MNPSKTYYSPSTRGFYSDAVHGENIPADAIEISAEQHAQLLEGVNAGQRIVIESGVPVLADPLPPSDEELAASARAKRDRLLKDSDWTLLPDAPVNRDAWKEYRQALRDVTGQSGFPQTITWPTPPGA